MPKYFFAPDELNGDLVRLSHEASHHLLNVLRLDIGGHVILCNGLGVDFPAVLIGAEGSGKSGKLSAIFKVAEGMPSPGEPSVKITLFQSLPKGDKLDLIVQKCVELGVHEIVPVVTSRSIPRAKDWEKRGARLRKIVVSAAQQSMRGIIPEVQDVCAFAEAIKIGGRTAVDACHADEMQCIAAYEDEHERDLKPAILEIMTPLNTASNQQGRKRIGIWIGPEGGFSLDEITALRENSIMPVSLGARILRTETAAIAAVAQIICLCE